MFLQEEDGSSGRRCKVDFANRVARIPLSLMRSDRGELRWKTSRSSPRRHHSVYTCSLLLESKLACPIDSWQHHSDRPQECYRIFISHCLRCSAPPLYALSQLLKEDLIRHHSISLQLLHDKRHPIREAALRNHTYVFRQAVSAIHANSNSAHSTPTSACPFSRPFSWRC